MKVRRLLLDLTPLRVSRDYRLLWLGDLVSETGFQVALVALYVQVYRLTGSAAAVGAIGLVQIVPLAVSSIAGSSIVDAIDRRKILLVAQVAYAAASGVLLFTAVTDRPPIWIIYGATALLAGIGGIAVPTHSAAIAQLVGRRHLASAMTLGQVLWNGTALVGPAIGGVIVERLGLAWAYGIDVVTYAGAFVAALLIRPIPPVTDGDGRAATGWRAIREGYSYVRGRRVLQSTFAIDLVAMIFGMPRALFPVLAVTQFHRGPAVVGLLFAAPAVGALFGALTAGWIRHVRHQGKAVALAVVVWGAGIVAFGTAGSNLPLALLFLAIAGGADMVSAALRSTILQSSVPDSLRGRVSAIHILVVVGGPRLGDAEAGFVAQLLSPGFSVVSGGLLCIVGAGLLAWVVPEFRRYHAGEDT